MRLLILFLILTSTACGKAPIQIGTNTMCGCSVNGLVVYIPDSVCTINAAAESCDCVINSASPGTTYNPGTLIPNPVSMVCTLENVPS